MKRRRNVNNSGGKKAKRRARGKVMDIIDFVFDLIIFWRI